MEYSTYDHFSDEFMSAFGRFIAQWNHFELDLAHIFHQIIGGDLETALCIFYLGGGFASHRDLLVASSSPNFRREVPGDIQSLLTDAEKISTIRNDLVHGQWRRMGPDIASVAVYKPRNKMRSYSFDATTESLIEWRDEAAKLTDRAGDICQEIDASRRKPSEPDQPQ